MMNSFSTKQFGRVLVNLLVTLILIHFISIVDNRPDSEKGLPLVSVEDGDFVRDGEPFRFAGTNAYYLPTYEKIDPAFVSRTLDQFEEAGVEVIRMWAFYDGYDCGYSQHDPSENVIQTSPGIYDEEALQHLDRVIAKGRERGIYFILPLLNYWDELGGICQYNTWAGAQSPSRNMEFFLNSNETQRWFRNYIEMLLNRVNTVTGTAYKDESAILSWQIINEGRFPSRDPGILRDWYREMAQFIKTISPNQLVGTGEEGLESGIPQEYSTGEYSNHYILRGEEGSSFILNTLIPEIDYGSAHWYPQEYGFGWEPNPGMIRAQSAWLKDHQEIAASIGKPFILAEYGYAGWGDSRVFQVYDHLWSNAEQLDVDGTLLWQLTIDHVKCTEFGGNICWPDGRRDRELYNRYLQHIGRMSDH